MKIAKSQLKQIIGEEVQKLDEIPTWRKIVQRRNRPRPEPEEPEEELSDEQKHAEIDKLLSHLYADREKVEQELEAGKSVRDMLSYPWVRRSKLIKYTLRQIAKLKGEKIHHSLREETLHEIIDEEIEAVWSEATSLLDNPHDSAGWPRPGTSDDIYKGAPCLQTTREHGTQKFYKGDKGYEKCVENRKSKSK